jgi:hypothetical protein
MSFLDFGRFLAGCAREKSSNCVSPKLIHDYFNTDVEIIWKAVQEDIPQLKTMISRVLEDLEDV